MSKRIPLLEWDTPAEKVLEEFPMLKGATTGELALMRATTEEDMVEEDQALLRAIDILYERMKDSDYFPADDTDDTPYGGGAKVPV